jgi:hypothetical protein
MRELPIRYLAPMVRAVRDGNKTQTRRIIKPQPPIESEPSFIISSSRRQDVGKWQFDANLDELIKTTALGPIACPYGRSGDRQWVQEAWRVSSAHDYLSPSKLPKKLAVEYLADGTGMFDGKTRRSIHLPRGASRITLEVTGVRVQRLQDISETDAQAEGIAELPLQAGQPGAWWSADPVQPALHGRTPVDAFRLLWESIYGQGSWSDNPMVWAISFKLIHQANPPS